MEERITKEEAVKILLDGGSVECVVGQNGYVYEGAMIRIPAIQFAIGEWYTVDRVGDEQQ